ncbi:MAG: hypothetical protein IJU50_06630 [Lachnospiraceae bacterium]|nr:hypothetical protein [Lachnospiraceae bacterium]
MKENLIQDEDPEEESVVSAEEALGDDDEDDDGGDDGGDDSGDDGGDDTKDEPYWVNLLDSSDFFDGRNYFLVIETDKALTFSGSSIALYAGDGEVKNGKKVEVSSEIVRYREYAAEYEFDSDKGYRKTGGKEYMVELKYDESKAKAAISSFEAEELDELWAYVKIAGYDQYLSAGGFNRNTDLSYTYYDGGKKAYVGVLADSGLGKADSVSLKVEKYKTGTVEMEALIDGKANIQNGRFEIPVNRSPYVLGYGETIPESNRYDSWDLSFYKNGTQVEDFEYADQSGDMLAKIPYSAYKDQDIYRHYASEGSGSSAGINGDFYVSNLGTKAADKNDVDLYSDYLSTTSDAIRCDVAMGWEANYPFTCEFTELGSLETIKSVTIKEDDLKAVKNGVLEESYYFFTSDDLKGLSADKPYMAWLKDKNGNGFGYYVSFFTSSKEGGGDDKPEPAALDSVSIVNPEEVSLTLGDSGKDTYQLIYSKTPVGADVSSAKWELAQASELVSLSESGLLTALKEGEGTVSVKLTADGKEASADIKVKVESGSKPQPGEYIRINMDGGSFGGSINADGTKNGEPLWASAAGSWAIPTGKCPCYTGTAGLS